MDHYHKKYKRKKTSRQYKKIEMCGKSNFMLVQIIYRNLTLKQQGEIKSKVKFEFVYSSSIRLKNDRGYGIIYDTKFLLF